jgi:hypothetical protein
MNKWKVGFIVTFILLSITVFYLIRIEIRNSFKTVDNSLISSYTIHDINFLNEFLSLKATNHKFKIQEIIENDTSYNYVRMNNDTIILRMYDIILNEKNELKEIKFKDSHFFEINGIK